MRSHSQHGGAASPRVAVVAALPEELSAVVAGLGKAVKRTIVSDSLSSVHFGELAGVPVVVAALGDGRARSRAALLSLQRHVPLHHVVVLGFAGGLTPGLRLGDVVRAKRVGAPRGPWFALAACERSSHGAAAGSVWSAQRLVVECADKARILKELPGAHGPAVVDLESHGLVEACQAKGLSVDVLRAVTDPADEALPSVLAGAAREDGSVSRGKLAARALGRPWCIPSLWNLKKKADACAPALFAACSRLVVEELSSQTARPGG